MSRGRGFFFKSIPLCLSITEEVRICIPGLQFSGHEPLHPGINKWYKFPIGCLNTHGLRLALEHSLRNKSFLEC